MNKIKEIIVGTNNAGKYKEICNLLPQKIKKYSPKSFKLISPDETGNTFEKAKILGIDMLQYLNKYDSYVAFKKLRSLLITGPTGVNVNDIRAIIVR